MGSLCSPDCLSVAGSSADHTLGLAHHRAQLDRRQSGATGSRESNQRQRVAVMGASVAGLGEQQWAPLLVECLFKHEKH